MHFSSNHFHCHYIEFWWKRWSSNSDILYGATAGIAFASLLGIDKGTLSAIGLVSVLAGSTNTPIASSIMAIELFGAGIAPYAALSCIVSFLITGHRSIYPSQIIGMRKSTSIQVEIGKEASKIKPMYEMRKKSLTERFLNSLDQ